MSNYLPKTQKYYNPNPVQILMPLKNLDVIELSWMITMLTDYKPIVLRLWYTSTATSTLVHQVYHRLS